MKKFIENFSVSHETICQLKTYLSLLQEWQTKFNLVSKSSLEDAWNRHFLDSMQLFKYIPQSAKTLVDFGSGAGFPGMVLAIMAKENTPYLKVTLVESIKKKTMYLNEVAKVTSTPVTIINDRIENLPPQKADVITSRAMCSLDELLKYAYRFTSRKTKCIFPKGKKYAEEISEAEKHWNFEYKIIPSMTSEEGAIVIITNLFAKGDK